jgi:endoglucanase Acf2
MKKSSMTVAAVAAVALGAAAQEVVRCGEGSYASYAPWRLARTFGADGKIARGGDQSRIMQNRPVYLTHEMAERVKKGEPIPTNDWWTDALVSQWTGNLWSYPAKVRIGANGVRVAYPSYWIDNGTEMKERAALVVGAEGAFNPEATLVSDWHDWDVEMELRDGAKKIRTTLVHGSPFTWIEAKGVELKLSVENGENLPVRRRNAFGGEVIAIGDEIYGVWRGRRGDVSWVAIGLAPDEAALEKIAPYATAIIRSTRVDWKYDEKTATLATTWNVDTEDISGKAANPVALQGFQPHHLKRTKPQFKCIDGLVWQTPRGKQRVAAGNALSIVYDFPGMLPYWAAPIASSRVSRPPSAYNDSLFKDLLADYAARGSFGGDTYWGGKGLLQMAFAMMAAREIGDAETFRKAHGRLRAKFEDWLTWDPGEEKFFFSYVPKWGGLVGEGTSYDSDTFNDHHFHYGYFTYAGALLAMVDADFAAKFGPMLKLIAQDYANWDRAEKRFPFFRMFDPWAGHSFAGGMGDGNGNGQESTSEAMQGWGGMYLLGLALGDDAMRDAAIFGYVSEARGTAEYWFDRDRENIDYAKYKHPYNSNLTCHGVGWWTWFSGDPVWMHSIQWLPNTPALDYLSEDLEFAKWDWETMWKSKEIGGWFEKGKTRGGQETPPVGNESLGNVLLSYLQRHDPAQAAAVFDELREKKMGAAMNADTAHMTYWATHSHLSFGELDFSVRADYPCARAYLKDGKRTLMVYNCGNEPRKVRFFAADGCKAVGEVVAKPRALTVSSELPNAVNPVNPVNPVQTIKPTQGKSLIPKGVTMSDLAQGKKVVVTSEENVGLRGVNITDGDDKTRWSSSHDDPEPTATIDLGETVELYGAEIKWENAYASKYVLECSADGAKWSPLGGERGGIAGLQRVDFGGEKARYVRLRGLEKATQYGVSLFSFSVYGKQKGAKPSAPLGFAIGSDRPVLKEGVASALSARAWLGGDKFRPVEAVWSSDDGTFQKNMFTPTKNDFAIVRASVGGVSVEKRIPVEEALVATRFSSGPDRVALDQFGGAMPSKAEKSNPKSKRNR